jgi:hypothetical protein
VSTLAKHWKYGRFDISYIGMSGYDTCIRKAVGWVNGPFALDKYKRHTGDPEPKYWTLTHLPTGRIISHPRTLREGKSLAARLAPLMAWERVTTSKKRGKRWAEIRRIAVEANFA